LRGGFEVFDEFAETEGFAGGAKGGFELGEGDDAGGGGVLAEEVPCVEAGKVLEEAEELVAADWGAL